jgi:HEAT repeat protein
MDEQTSVSELIGRLKHDRPEVRQVAAKRLRRFSEAQSVEPLIMALQDDDEAVRRSAAKTLGVIGDIRALEPLLALVEDEDITVRSSATYALGRLGDARAVALLGDLLQDSSESVRHAAVRALRLIGGDPVVDLLGDALQDDNETIRRSAVEGLKSIGGCEVIEILGYAIEDEDPHVRSMAVEALGEELGGTGNAGQTLESIVKALQDENETVRQQAAKTLGRIGDSRAIEFLEIALRDEKRQVRHMAIRALGWIRDSNAVSILITVLDEDDEKARYLAAEALGKIGATSAAESLGILLNDETYQVRRSAVKALRRIGGFESFAILAGALLDNQWGYLCNTLHYWPDDLPGTSKAEYIIDEVLSQVRMTSTQFRANLLFRAMLPSPKDKSEDEKAEERDKLCRLTISKAVERKEDAVLTSYLADLLCYGAPGRDKAADLIQEYQEDHNLQAEDLYLLRKYVGGERALEPILAHLQANLDDHFLEPIDALNEATLDMWEDTVRQAKRGFDTRIGMSIAIFIIGALASLIALYQLTFGDLDKLESFLGPGVALVTGLGSMAATFFFGPLREIQKSVTDLSVIHIAFIGYVHRVLEISQTFAAIVLQKKMDFAEMEKSNHLIEAAMLETFKILRPDVATSIGTDLEERLRAESSRQAPLRVGEPSDTT